MNSSQANFYKPNSSKIKLTNVYPYDSFRPGSINEFTNRGKSSLSSNKMISQKEFFNKTRRNNSHQNNFNCYNIPFKFNDIDKLVEEVTNFKLEMNKKNKEIHSLKIAFAKLDEENKKNIHILEEVIIEANKHKRNNGDGFKFDPEDLANEIRNCLTYSVTSDKLLAKLLESHAINNMKRQIYDYKTILASKDEELTSFKANSRISKFQEVDGKLKNLFEELINLKENYSMLMNLFNEKESRLREVLEEKENYKSQNQKLKFQNEEFKDRLLAFQEANTKISEQIKFIEDKNSTFKYQISAYKTQLKEKEQEVAKLKSDLSAVESYKANKEKHEKTLKNLNANLTNLKEDLERKSNKLREMQRKNSHLKQRAENVETKKNSDLASRNKDNKSIYAGKKEFEETSVDDKDKKIKNLEEANVKLRKEIIKLKDDLISIADNQLENIEKEFNNNNTNENLPSEINHIIIENKKDEISQFERNLEKELMIRDDLESENKFSDLSKPLNIMENKDKASHRSLSSKHRLQAQINISRNNNNPHKTIDNQRYYQDLEEEQVNSKNNNDYNSNGINENNKRNNFENNFNKKTINENEENLKHSINNSLNKEENNFNYSDFKNKNDFEDDFSNFNKELKKEENINKLKRPENSKKKASANNKEKLNQMLIEEENRNLNSSSENNVKNIIDNNDLDACEEYLKEHDDLNKSDDDSNLYKNDIENNNIGIELENDKIKDIENNDIEKFEDYEKQRESLKTPFEKEQSCFDSNSNYKQNLEYENYQKELNEADNSSVNYENEDNKYDDFAEVDKENNLE